MTTISLNDVPASPNRCPRCQRLTGRRVGMTALGMDIWRCTSRRCGHEWKTMPGPAKAGK